MKRNQDWYIDRTNRLLQDNQNALAKMRYIDQMYHGEWRATWPDGVTAPTWWRDLPIAKPRIDLDAGTNMFASLAPKIKLNPLSDNQDTRDRSNMVEKALAWQYWLAGNRGRSNSITKDIVFNTLAYGRCPAQVNYMPWMRKNAGSRSANGFWDVAGDFDVQVHHPSTCFPVFSPYGLESEVVVKQMDESEIAATWPDSADKLRKWVGDDANSRPVLYYMDWTDHDRRFVAVFKTGSNDTVVDPTDIISAMPVGGEKIVLLDEENDLPFLNWVDMSTGGETYRKPEHRNRGLLDVLYDFDQWNSINIWNSFQRSYAYRSLAKLDGAVVSASGETPREINTETMNLLMMNPGDDFKALPLPQLDPRIAQLKAEDITEMGNSTIPELLSSPSAPSGTAYATINEVYTIAKSKIDPFINTAQDIIAGIDALMLRWYMHTGDPLTGYETKYNNLTKQTTGTGKEINIPADTIPHQPVMGKEMDNEGILRDVVKGRVIYLTTALTAAMPIDKVQALNGAAIMKQIGYDDETIFENLEEEDPRGIIRRRQQQEFTNTAIGNHIQEMQAETQAKIQRMMAQVQMEAQQQMMAMQQQAQQPQQPPVPDQQTAPIDQQAAVGQITPGQQTQQALARAAAGQDVMPPDLTAMLAAAKGVNPGMGDMSPTALAPGQTPRRTERGPKGERRSN